MGCRAACDHLFIMRVLYVLLLATTALAVAEVGIGKGPEFTAVPDNGPSLNATATEAWIQTQPADRQALHRHVLMNVSSPYFVNDPEYQDIQLTMQIDLLELRRRRVRVLLRAEDALNARINRLRGAYVDKKGIVSIPDVGTYFENFTNATA